MTNMLPTSPLVVPAAGDNTTHGLVRRLRLTAMRAMLEHDLTGASAELASDIERARAAVVGATKRDPEKALEAIGAPDVLVPVLTMLGGQTTSGAALAAAMPNLLTSLAGDGLLDADMEWASEVGLLADSRHRRAAQLAPPRRSLVFGPAGVTDPSGHDIQWTRPYTPLGASLPGCHLATLDTNPLGAIEAHPDKQGNAVDLGGATADDWCASIAAATELVSRALPALAKELTLTLRRVVPVGYDAERHLSASYREAPGLVYMTLHPNPVTMAEAIVHETQHGKLNALTWFDPVLRNGHSEWTESPVRPDLRPLQGVLLAAHAFVPVAAMHTRLTQIGHPITADPWFERRRREVLETNERSMTTLSGLGDFTKRGRALFDGLQQLHAATRDAS